MIIQEISSSRVGNFIFDNGKLYFEPGDHDQWNYPVLVSFVEIQRWYVLIAEMSGAAVEVDWLNYHLVNK